MGYYVGVQTLPVSVELADPCSTSTELIGSAKSVVRLAVYQFYVYDEKNACTNRVAEALVRARKRGVDVVVYLDDDQRNKKVALFLLSNGIRVRVYRGKGLLHAKVLLVDNCFLIGSSNYTYSGFFRNMEINLKVCGPPARFIRSWFERLDVLTISAQEWV